MIAWGVWLGLLGCGDMSNQVFYEDAEFLEALPTRENFQVEYTPGFDYEAFYAQAGALAPLYELTVGAVGLADLYLEEITWIADTARSRDPSLRDRDHRVWGPFHWSELAPEEDLYLRVEMTREPTGSRYNYAFWHAESAADEGTKFFVGTHYAGETIAMGDGSVEWFVNEDTDHPGSMRLAYDLRGGLALRVDLEDMRFGDAPAESSSWSINEEGGFKTIAFTSEWNLDEEGAPECVKLESRWGAATGEGRSDGVFYAGALGEGADVLGCWDAAGLPTVVWDSMGFWEHVGDPATDCAVARSSVYDLPTVPADLSCID